MRFPYVDVHVLTYFAYALDRGPVCVGFPTNPGPAGSIEAVGIGLVRPNLSPPRMARSKIRGSGRGRRVPAARSACNPETA